MWEDEMWGEGSEIYEPTDPEEIRRDQMIEAEQRGDARAWLKAYHRVDILEPQEEVSPLESALNFMEVEDEPIDYVRTLDAQEEDETMYAKKERSRGIASAKKEVKSIILEDANEVDAFVQSIENEYAKTGKPITEKKEVKLKNGEIVEKEYWTRLFKKHLRKKFDEARLTYDFKVKLGELPDEGSMFKDVPDILATLPEETRKAVWAKATGEDPTYGTSDTLERHFTASDREHSRKLMSVLSGTKGGMTYAAYADFIKDPEIAKNFSWKKVPRKLNNIFRFLNETEKMGKKENLNRSIARMNRFYKLDKMGLESYPQVYSQLWSDLMQSHKLIIALEKETGAIRGAELGRVLKEKINSIGETGTSVWTALIASEYRHRSETSKQVRENSEGWTNRTIQNIYRARDKELRNTNRSPEKELYSKIYGKGMASKNSADHKLFSKDILAMEAYREIMKITGDDNDEPLYYIASFRVNQFEQNEAALKGAMYFGGSKGITEDIRRHEEWKKLKKKYKPKPKPTPTATPTVTPTPTATPEVIIETPRLT
jgi:hypothetical protein